jgi:hypothetical protein
LAAAVPVQPGMQFMGVGPNGQPMLMMMVPAGPPPPYGARAAPPAQQHSPHDPTFHVSGVYGGGGGRGVKGEWMEERRMACLPLPLLLCSCCHGRCLLNRPARPAPTSLSALFRRGLCAAARAGGAGAAGGPRRACARALRRARGERAVCFLWGTACDCPGPAGRVALGTALWQLGGVHACRCIALARCPCRLSPCPSLPPLPRSPTAEPQRHQSTSSSSLSQQQRRRRR